MAESGAKKDLGQRWRQQLALTSSSQNRRDVVNSSAPKRIPFLPIDLHSEGTSKGESVYRLFGVSFSCQSRRKVAWKYMQFR